MFNIREAPNGKFQEVWVLLRMPEQQSSQLVICFSLLSLAATAKYKLGRQDVRQENEP